PDPGRPTLKLFGQGLDISLYLSLLTLPKSEGCSPLAALDNAVLLPGLINSGGDDPATRRTVKFDLDLGAYADVGDAKLRAATILANSYRSRTPGAANREGVPGQGNASRRVGGTPRKDAATWEADSRQYVHNLILHAESEDIAVTWDSLPKHKGGFV